MTNLLKGLIFIALVFVAVFPVYAENSASPVGANTNALNMGAGRTPSPACNGDIIHYALSLTNIGLFPSDIPADATNILLTLAFPDADGNPGIPVVIDNLPYLASGDTKAYNESNTPILANILTLNSGVTSVQAIAHFEGTLLFDSPTQASGSVTLTTSISCGTVPTVDIKANGFDVPITIDYDTAANLTWTSVNANHCYAVTDWSGEKPINGSEQTIKLTSSKTYTIICLGSVGSTSDAVTVNVIPMVVATNTPPTGGGSSTGHSVSKLVRNLSDGTNYEDSVLANPSEILSFSITVKAGSLPMQNVIVKDILPTNISWRQDSLKLNGLTVSGNILTGLNIGNLSPGQEKTITFTADLSEDGNFNFGNTELVNSVLISSSQPDITDTAKITVVKAVVAGGATSIPTGLTNNIFVDSVVIPLAVVLILIFSFKSHIFKIEEWIDLRKNEYQKFKSDKILRAKIKKANFQETINEINNQKAILKRIG